MGIHQDTIWQQFLQPIFSLLIDENSLKKLSSSINWKQEYDRLESPNLVYPQYYQSQNFHGITGGYLTSSFQYTKRVTIATVKTLVLKLFFISSIRDYPTNKILLTGRQPR